jgi:hypothetical protein
LYTTFKQAELTSNKPNNETGPMDLPKTIHPSVYSPCPHIPLEAMMPLSNVTATKGNGVKWWGVSI